jgi:hypothetical protein
MQVKYEITRHWLVRTNVDRLKVQNDENWLKSIEEKHIVECI